MKPNKMLKKEYRILATAIIFFAVGLFFFVKNEQPAEKSNDYTKPPNLQVVQNSFADPIFAKYPSPVTFLKFGYDARGIDGKGFITVSSTCHDAYLTILMFPANVDYRNDLTKAVFNTAFPCEIGKNFTYDINADSLSNIPVGEYYAVLADQGNKGVWYNAR